MTYAYDDLSRLTSAVNENGTVSFTYDNRGRVASTTDVNARAITYTYDAASNRTLMKLIGANHSTYVYDAANRLTTLTDEAKKNFTFAYDNADRLTTKTLPNTVATTYAYDGMSRLTRLKDAKGTATLFDRNYSYDPANQISQIAEPTQTKIFSYDNLDRLTQMTNGVSNENYVFDSVGNRTSSHRSATHSYQPYNQMSATANSTMSYDSNGNMISRSQGASSWTYVWDHQNRMKSATSGATSVSFAYDALGRRVKRTQGTQITKFTYDGLDVVMDDVNGTLTKYQNGPGIDNKLKLVTGTTSSYFLTDHLGSTNALTNSTGAITSSATYDSFGNQAGNLATRYSYTGREYDSFTGLNYYRNRGYDANIGHFISEDPIGFGGGGNWYAYANNSPNAFVDPLGTDVFAIFYRSKGKLVVDDYSKHWFWGTDQVKRYEFNNIFSGERGSFCMNSNRCDADRDEGPIPRGAYLIDRSPDPNENAAWKKISYRLFRSKSDNRPWDGPFGKRDEYVDIRDPFTGETAQRGGFFIHPGSFSSGCITFPKTTPDGEVPWSSEYGRLDSIFKGTSDYIYKGQRFSGRLIVVD